MIASKNGWTGLTRSLYYNMLDMAKNILKSSQFKPENINLVNKAGETALGYATAYGMADIVPLLLKKGASPYKNGEMYDFSEKDLEKYLSSCITFESQMKKISESSLQLDYKFSKTTGASKNDENKGVIIEDATFKSQERKDGPYKRPQESTEMFDIPEVKVDNGTQSANIPELETKALEDMANQYKNLLKHPLIRIFLMLKYSRVKFLYNIWIAMKIIFLCLLVALVMQDCTFTRHEGTPDNPKNKTNVVTIVMQDREYTCHEKTPDTITIEKPITRKRHKKKTVTKAPIYRKKALNKTCYCWFCSQYCWLYSSSWRCSSVWSQSVLGSASPRTGCRPTSSSPAPTLPAASGMVDWKRRARRSSFPAAHGLLRVPI